MIDRNPSAPSHVNQAQAVRLTGMTVNRLRYLLKIGLLTTETHYGSKMIPMWSIAQFLRCQKPDGLE